MATALMRWLERRPHSYERGVQWLTLGRLRRLHARLVDRYNRPGMRVLELGCGSGELACRMAAAGAQVVAVDIHSEMLGRARQRADAAGLKGRIAFLEGDVTQLESLPLDGPFDLIVASLLFSELPRGAWEVLLERLAQGLAPGGLLLIVDEFPPRGLRGALWLSIRLLAAALAWLLTQTGTTPLRDFDQELAAGSWEVAEERAALGGTLRLLALSPASERAAEGVLVPVLEPWPVLRAILLELWALFLRILPPYPKISPGLYALGEPGEEAPVLVTGNFALTVKRLVGALHGRLDAWLVVADSRGLNVWCGAGGGFLTAQRILAALQASGLEARVSHRRLILPQLCANGVDGWALRRAGWEVHWGPVRAADLPAYLSQGMQKDLAMRSVDFPWPARLEMVSATLGFHGPLILLPVALFWRELWLPALIALVGLSYTYALLLPWLPGRDGLAKSPCMVGLALAGLLLYSLVWDPVPYQGLYGRALGVAGLAFFVSAEFQGMSPLMRGEQANWLWEGVVAALLAALYWLLPPLLGWR